LKIWVKDDFRVLKIRNAYKTNEPNLTYSTYKPDPESFANLMLTLINTDNFLLDKMIHSLEEKFIREGGYSENLAKKRRKYRGY
jgi:four helix bundle suffix protein